MARSDVGFYCTASQPRRLWLQSFKKKKQLWKSI